VQSTHGLAKTESAHGCIASFSAGADAVLLADCCWLMAVVGWIGCRSLCVSIAVSQAEWVFPGGSPADRWPSGSGGGGLSSASPRRASAGKWR